MTYVEIIAPKTKSIHSAAPRARGETTTNDPSNYVRGGAIKLWLHVKRFLDDLQKAHGVNSWAYLIGDAKTRLYVSKTLGYITQNRNAAAHDYKLGADLQARYASTQKHWGFVRVLLRKIPKSAAHHVMKQTVEETPFALFADFKTRSEAEIQALVDAIVALEVQCSTVHEPMALTGEESSDDESSDDESSDDEDLANESGRGTSRSSSSYDDDSGSDASSASSASSDGGWALAEAVKAEFDAWKKMHSSEVAVLRAELDNARRANEGDDPRVVAKVNSDAARRQADVIARLEAELNDARRVQTLSLSPIEMEVRHLRGELERAQLTVKRERERADMHRHRLEGVVLALGEKMP